MIMLRTSSNDVSMTNVTIDYWYVTRYDVVFNSQFVRLLYNLYDYWYFMLYHSQTNMLYYNMLNSHTML